MPLNNREQVLALIKKEGNHYDFVNVKSGYECMISRNPTTGAWCGYVKLPVDHPFHDLSYSDLEDISEKYPIHVHGGLTFSEEGLFGFDCSHYGDYYIMGYDMMGMFGKFVTQIVESHERVMGGDKDLTYRTKEYAIEQTNNLAEQFYEYKNAVVV